MTERRRFKQSASFQDRLATFEMETRQRASQQPPGPERDGLIRKARRADDASNLDDWAKSLFAESGGSR